MTTDEAQPKYAMVEMLILRTLHAIDPGAYCTPGAVASTILASGSDHKVTEDQAARLLEVIQEKGGVTEKDGSYRLSTNGSTDLGPMLERPLSSF